MKRVALLFVLTLCAATTLQAENGHSFKGTVIKMEMTECVVAGFKARMSGESASAERCPAYTVLSPNVVYLVVGRRPGAFIPLAQDLDFHVIKNEVLAGEKSKSRFIIQNMMLRSDWEREQERGEVMAKSLEHSVSYDLHNSQPGTLTAAAK